MFCLLYLMMSVSNSTASIIIYMLMTLKTLFQVDSLLVNSMSYHLSTKYAVDGK